MLVYRREVEEILRRFLTDRMSRSSCFAALDAAMASVINVTGEADSEQIREVMKQASETVAVGTNRRRSVQPESRDI